MASTSESAAVVPAVNNNPAKVVCSDQEEERNPDDTTTENTTQCPDTQPTEEAVEPTENQMGNRDSSSEKNDGKAVKLELSPRKQTDHKRTVSSPVQTSNDQNVPKEEDNQNDETQETNKESTNQNHVQLATNGHGQAQIGSGPEMSNEEIYVAERPFVSTLGSPSEHKSFTSHPNGDLEEDGFRMRNHTRSYSERGSGVLRGRNSGLANANSSEEGTEFSEVRRRSGSVLEVKEQAYTRLKEELHSAQLELQLKDKECEKLSRIQSQMEKELEELTASLFEEANNMVQEANIKRMHTEKLLREANSKIEVLEAEVSALKTLVITSTPSMPNRHLHPQIDPKTSKNGEKFVKSHKRSTSHHDFKKEMETLQVVTIDPDIDPHQCKDENNREIDPVYYQEFKTWKGHPGLDASHAFLQRIIHEDILPCLNFANQELSQDVFDSVRNNVLTIELIPGKNSFPRRCALLDTTKLCQYRIRLRDTGPWYFISQFARNRITTVCDFYTYIRYIQQGLVKSDESSIYWEIIRLRKQMAMARLGVMS